MTERTKEEQDALDKELHDVHESLLKWQKKEEKEQSTIIADAMYKEYTKEKERGCHNLFLDTIKEKLWGHIVKHEVLPLFDKLYNLLVEKEHTSRKKSFVYNDTDIEVWVEEAAKDKQVIASISHCTFADANTHLYIQEHKFSDMGMHKFIVVKVWPREITSNSTHEWGDDRDIDKPSINTFRKRDFHYGYRDGRDNCHILKYTEYKDFISKKCDIEPLKDRMSVESPDEMYIPHAIQSLEWHLESLLKKIELKNYIEICNAK